MSENQALVAYLICLAVIVAGAAWIFRDDIMRRGDE